jgi:hypothetical protein
MMNWRQAGKVCVALLAIVATAGGALAQDTTTAGQVNISGATLFVNFFTVGGSTLDYIDVDGDGKFGGATVADVDQLAQTYTSLGEVQGATFGTGEDWWAVNYRGVGSGNGLKHMVNFHNTQPVDIGVPSDMGLFNRTAYSDDGAPGALYNATNDQASGIYNAGGTPILQDTVDIGVMDVPTTWFVKKPTAGLGEGAADTNASFLSNPGADGYGMNPITSWDGGQSNQLKDLGNLNTNTAPGQADENTVYDTPLAYVPISFITNRGTGIQNLSKEELGYIFTTGRAKDGRNLVACTRDSGSGTRNGGMSTINVDPSWGRGDNLGTKTKDSATDLAGPNFQPTNRGGSSRMEGAVQNSRLAIGYTGLIGGSRSAVDAKAGKYEVINVDGVRPNLASVICTEGFYHNLTSLDELAKGDLKYGVNIVAADDYDPTQHAGWTHVEEGYKVGGLETMATVGNPHHTYFQANPYYVAEDACNPMSSVPAAAYLVNIEKSIDDFEGLIEAGEDDPNLYTPAEVLVNSFVLTAGLTTIPASSDPGIYSDTQLNKNIREFLLENNSGMATPAWGSTNDAGKAPTRTAGVTYNDGSTTGSFTYYDGTKAAQTVDGGDTLTGIVADRNDVAGDWDGDDDVDLDDIDEMVVAMGGDNTPQASDFASWQQSNLGAIPAIIGDYNADGNVDAVDVRYHCDGLNVSGGYLARKAAFAAADTAASGNFFGTSKVNGYNAGDAFADIAGSSMDKDMLFGATPGAGPAGADNVINGVDRRYIELLIPDANKNLISGELTADMNGDGMLDWDDATEAVFMDLSADLNEDGKISAADLDAFDAVMLGAGKTLTEGDADWSGTVDTTDLARLAANWNTSEYVFVEQGDFSGDGAVDTTDLAKLAANWGSKGGAVPEPMTLSLVALGGLAAIRRRRR